MHSSMLFVSARQQLLSSTFSDGVFSKGARMSEHFLSRGMPCIMLLAPEQQQLLAATNLIHQGSCISGLDQVFTPNGSKMLYSRVPQWLKVLWVLAQWDMESVGA